MDRSFKIGVIGAGTMGLGIAQVFAQAGHTVILYDLQAAILTKAENSIRKNLDFLVSKGKMEPATAEGILQSIRFSTAFEDLKADFIIEAILEKLDLKQDLFGRLEAQNEPGSIFATNTSTIPITQIGAKLKHPERLVGVHFFNPAHIMKLVEIIPGAKTSGEITARAAQLITDCGKTVIHAKDAPGFIVNRVARHYYVEALQLLEEQVSDLEGIDRLMESSGFKMGPFRLMDLIGVDTNFSVTSSMYAQFHQDPKFRPSRIQQQKVDAGEHGRKSGSGFYKYEN